MEFLTITDIQARTGLSVSTIRRRLSQANVKGKRVTKSGGGVKILYSANVCAELFASDLVSDTVVKLPEPDAELLRQKYKIALQMVVRLRLEVRHQKEINTMQAQVITAATERERHLIDQSERYGRQLSVLMQQQKEVRQVATATPSGGMTPATAVIWFASAVVLIAAVIIAVLLFA